MGTRSRPRSRSSAVEASALASGLAGEWSLEIVDVPLQRRDDCGYHAVANSGLQLGQRSNLPQLRDWPIHLTAAQVTQAVENTNAARQIFVIDSVSSILDVADFDAHYERREIANACLGSAMDRIGKGLDTAIIVNDKEQFEGVEHGLIGHWISLVVRPHKKSIEFCDSKWMSGPGWRGRRQDLYGRVVRSLSLLCFLQGSVELAPLAPPPPPPGAPPPPCGDGMGDGDNVVFADPVAHGGEAAQVELSDGDEQDPESGREDDVLFDTEPLDVGDIGGEVFALYRSLQGMGIKTRESLRRVRISVQMFYLFFLSFCLSVFFCLMCSWYFVCARRRCCVLMPCFLAAIAGPLTLLYCVAGIRTARLD
jgi:hypothetical protein